MAVIVVVICQIRGGDHDPHTLLCMTRGNAQRIWLHNSFHYMGTYANIASPKYFVHVASLFGISTYNEHSFSL